MYSEALVTDVEGKISFFKNVFLKLQQNLQTVEQNAVPVKKNSLTTFKLLMGFFLWHKNFSVISKFTKNICWKKALPFI